MIRNCVSLVGPMFLLCLGAAFSRSAEPVCPTGATTCEGRMESWQHHIRLENESPFKKLKWRAVGPRLQGGRIECIACSPDNPYTIYVGPGAGNLWKTVNNGTTWKAIFENESTFAMGDVAVAPSDPSIVWLGTGEVLMARSSYAGTGVFKSTDGGQTWRNMGLTDSHHIGRVLIDPEDPDVVYVAALGHLYSDNQQRGLFKTTDGGDTWCKVLYIDEKTGVTDVVMDPGDHQTLYATAWQHERKAWDHVAYGPGSGIYKSTDAGTTWKKLSGGFPGGDDLGRVAVDVAASKPDVLYAICDRRGSDDAVYRSDDRGETWQQVNQQKVHAGYDFCMVRISPDNEDEIYLPGQRSFRSVDGGKTYTQIQGTLVHLLEHGSKVLHLDAHSFWIDPVNPDHLILGNDGGLHISYDRGQSWLHVNNLPIGEFYAVSGDMATPYNIYGGTQDNAALFGPSTHVVEDDEPDPWKHVYLDRWGGGDSYFTPVDPTDPETIYYEHQFGDLRRKNMKTGKSEGIRPKASEGEPPLRFNWMTPFVISQHDPATIYCGANRLFKSTDRGDTWTAISGDLSTDPGPQQQGNVPYGTITTISQSPLVPGLLYAGTDDGNVHVTRDDGRHWTQINAGLPPKWVSRVAASQHEPATVYVSLTGYRDDDFSTYLYASTDYGCTWTSIAGNLPQESVNVVAEDPAESGVLYVGTDLGVYTSVDAGRTWHSLCNHLPTTPVHDLFVHPRENELVIGTHGRSIFVLDVKPVQNLAKRVPHVIFLMADDLGYGDVGFNGNEIVRTPNLDRLAADGIRFTRFYSVGPVCSPTRVCVQTGRHYMRCGMVTVNVGKLPKQEITLPKIAKAKGYTTGHFGKWHLGGMTTEPGLTQVRGKRAAKGYGPPWQRGYDATFTTETNIATWDPLDYTGLRIPKHSCRFWSNGELVEGPWKGSSERIIMDRALDFISGAVRGNKPFLATIWFYGPHSPVRAGKELRDLYPDQPLGRQHYLGAITSIDREVGRLRSKLEELGALENTLIFFCSDNGPEGTGRPEPEYNPYGGAYCGSAGEFRGRKRWLYNGGVCVPAFAVWPRVIRPGQTVATPACTLDYVPTLMELLGYRMPDDRPIDGTSIAALLRSGAGWKRDKAIPFGAPLKRESPEVALIRGEYKFCAHWGKPGGGEELYHLYDDPSESRNIIDQHPQVAESMKRELRKWIASCRKSYEGGDYSEPYEVQGRFLRLAEPGPPGEKAEKVDH